MTHQLSDAARLKIEDWLINGSVGTSSKTLASAALGIRIKNKSHRDAPHDPADFHRCFQLVKAVPEVVYAFPAVAKSVPTFKRILENWEMLSAIHKRDVTQGESLELFYEIQRLRGDVEQHVLDGLLRSCQKAGIVVASQAKVTPKNSNGHLTALAAKLVAKTSAKRIATPTPVQSEESGARRSRKMTR